MKILLLVVVLFAVFGVNNGFLSGRPTQRCTQLRMDDDEEEEDDEPPQVDISNFRMPEASAEPLSFGYNKGRSSPNQRKAMGRASNSVAKIFICSHCGSEQIQWMGRCPTCKQWGTLQEHAVTRQSDPSAGVGRPVFGSRRSGSWLEGVDSDDVLGQGKPVRITDLYQKSNNATSSPSFTNRRRERLQVPNDEELNTVLGGGIMPGSLLLVGGEPGVGKSTLLLQTAGSIASSLSRTTPVAGMGLPENFDEKEKVGPVWYCSGEESPDQIASRALRLGIESSELWLLSETHADSLCAQVADQLHPLKYSNSRSQEFDPEEEMSALEMFQPLPPSLVIIDSIQTMVCDAAGNSAAGGVAQVRECVAMFLRLAKSTSIPIMLVGHVTKSGDVAGPRTVEHMVDCVLYLEGSADPAAGMNRLRVLRASKNRFGSSDECGVYEMTSGRLLPVSDPSSLFLSHRMAEEDAEGCAIAIALEGMRAITVEVQALVTSAGGNAAFGRRTVDGISSSRLMLLMGVLQKRCGLSMSRSDVFVNVAGRMRLDRGEGNAADLAVAMALVSSLLQIGVRADTAFAGEIGLLGELRPVLSIEKRINEARRMGFSRVVSPIDRTIKGSSMSSSKNVHVTKINGIEWIQCRKLYDALQAGLVSPIPKRRKQKSSKQAPSTLEELGLDEIMDDEDDEEQGFQ